MKSNPQTKKTAFSSYLENNRKIERATKSLSKFSSGSGYNGEKMSEAQKKLDGLYQKEIDILDTFTKMDKEKYEKHFQVPFEYDNN